MRFRRRVMFLGNETSPLARAFRQALMVGFVALGIAAGNAAAQPAGFPNSFAAIAKRVEPAVVSIEAKGKASDVVAKGGAGESEDVMEFFRRQIAQRPVYSLGSGFIVDKTGLILTNEHVIEDAARITVKLESGDEFTAKVMGIDEETDLAVLKIEAGRDLPFLKFGDSDKTEVGDWVLAVGSPFGLAKSVTAGIISQKQRETPNTTAFQRFIQTDAAINRGNSGGPLVNLDGDVIGINSQIATTTGDSNGVGFALPSGEAETVYRQIVANGRVRRGYLGAYLDSVKVEFAKVYGLKDARGAIVTDIKDSKSAAALAGLQAGDVIIEFDGQTVDNAPDLIAKVAAALPDKAVNIVVLRENGPNMERKTLSIKIAERPLANIASVDDGERRKLLIDGVKPEEKPFGLSLAELTPTLAATYKLEGQKGLVVKEISPTSFIADVRNEKGVNALLPGDLIQRINRVSVTDLKTFGQTVAMLKTGDPVVLQVITYNPKLGATQMKIVQFTVK